MALVRLEVRPTAITSSLWRSPFLSDQALEGELAPGFNRAQLEAAFNSGKGAVVNRGEIVATYERS